MTTTTHVPFAEPDDGLEVLSTLPARAAKAMGAIHELVDLAGSLEKIGYPSGGALLNALSDGESLPDVEEYVQRVSDVVRVSLICGWDLGAYSWWFHRVVDQATIDRARVELDGEDGAKERAAFESFNKDFESSFPELAQRLSVSIDQINNGFWRERGLVALAELQPELEAALAKLAADRRLVTV
jgi:hypothetical protein